MAARRSLDPPATVGRVVPALSRRGTVFGDRGHRWPARLWRAAQAVPLVAVFTVFPVRPLDNHPAPMHVRVDGSVRILEPGTTLGRAGVVLGLQPRSGDLVDVEGLPIERGRFRGFLEVNGLRAAPGMVLAAGDRIRVVDARDRLEPVIVKVVPVPEGQVPNPQTHLGMVPGDQIITTGSISGKLVSSLFRPTGAADLPRSVALTFDDGPSPTFTPRILRILKTFEVKATFFMVGSLVERYPDVAKQVVDAGMAVGNHSFQHPNSPPFAKLPMGQMEAQIAGGHRRLEAVGVEAELFRPPGGSWNESVLSAAESVGERTVLWSIDAEDWLSPTPAAIARRVLDHVGPGSIILLHDGGGDRTPTVKALPRILRGLRKMGLAVEAL